MRSRFAPAVFAALALAGMALPRSAYAHTGGTDVELCGGRHITLDLPWKHSRVPEKDDCAFACHAVTCRRRAG